MKYLPDIIDELYTALYPYQDSKSEKNEMPQEVIDKYKHALSRAIFMIAGLMAGSSITAEQLTQLTEAIKEREETHA